MNAAEEKTSLPDAVLRENFKKKLKSWFESKGINHKLETYLRSQMIIEFQNTCGSAVNVSQNPSLSPKLQAVKLLIADFLVQEDLLFSLSVFVSEVPFLSNLPSYTQYVKQLAQPRCAVTASAKPTKPKFTDAHLFDLFDALNLTLSKEEVLVVRDQYEASKYSSLLVTLLSMLPVLLKKYRNIDQLLNKARKREKYYRKLTKTERTKTKQMYSVLQDAYKLVQKHKYDINDAQQKQNECKERFIAVEKQSIDLARRETELTSRQQSLESKERAYEQKYTNKFRELEKKLKILEEQDREIQSKYKALQDEQNRLQTEKQLFETLKSQMHATNSRESEKLEEYERRFRALQEQMLEVVKKYDDKEKHRLISTTATNSREIQCVLDTLNQSQQTENDTYMNIEEYVHLIEKENALLKLSSNKQRYRINQLTSEMLALRNKLEYLENEVKIRKRLEQENRIHEVAHKLYFPPSPREKLAALSASKSRRRLFADDDNDEDEMERNRIPESSSSDLSAANNLTDEIVADAKTKLKELEAESETLNRNFKNLQNVLSRNMMFADRTFGSSSMSDSSPRGTHRSPRLTRSISDPDSSNADSLDLRKTRTSGISDSRLNKSDNDMWSPRRRNQNVPFSRIFHKYRKQRKTNEGTSLDEGLVADRVDETSPNRQRAQLKIADEVLQSDVKSGPVTTTDEDVRTNVEPDACTNVADQLQNAEQIANGFQEEQVSETESVKIVLESRSASDNNEPGESASGNKEIISVGSSNGSKSSDFWQ